MMRSLTSRRLARPGHQSGFTLLEMMVVISIIAVMASMTAAAFVAMNKGRAVREASRIVQAALLKARDKAVELNRPVGVRLVTDGDDPSIVRGLLLVYDTAKTITGTCSVLRPSNRQGFYQNWQWIPNPIERNKFLRKELEKYLGSDPELLEQIYNELISLGWNQYPRLERYIKMRTNMLQGIEPPEDPAEPSYWVQSVTGDQIYNVDTPPLMVVAALGLDGKLTDQRNGGPFFESRFGKGGQIRFEESGPFYDFLWLTNKRVWLTGVTPAVPMYNPAARNGYPWHLYRGVKYEIRRRGVSTTLMPGTEPVILPDGVVIDLGQVPKPNLRNSRSIQNARRRLASPRNRLSRIEPARWIGDRNNRREMGGEYWRWEIVFAPNRKVVGANTKLKNLGIWIREESEFGEERGFTNLVRDASGRRAVPSSSPRRALSGSKFMVAQNHALVTVDTMTGDVASSRPVLENREDYRDFKPTPGIPPDPDYYDFEYYYYNVDRGINVGL